MPQSPRNFSTSAAWLELSGRTHPGQPRQRTRPALAARHIRSPIQTLNDRPIAGSSLMSSRFWGRLGGFDHRVGDLHEGPGRVLLPEEKSWGPSNQLRNVRALLGATSLASGATLPRTHRVPSSANVRRPPQVMASGETTFAPKVELSSCAPRTNHGLCPHPVAASRPGPWDGDGGMAKRSNLHAGG
jgi:hypothetical protein